MDKEKLTSILNELQGISNEDWCKLRNSIDAYYKAEIDKQNNEIKLEDLSFVIGQYGIYQSNIAPRYSLTETTLLVFQKNQNPLKVVQDAFKDSISKM